MLTAFLVALLSIDSVHLDCGRGGALEDEVDAGAYQAYRPIKPEDKIVIGGDQATDDAPVILNVFVRRDERNWDSIGLGEANSLEKDFTTRNGDRIVVGITEAGGAFPRPGHDFFGASLTAAGALKACFRIPFPKSTNPQLVHFDSIGYARDGKLLFRFHSARAKGRLSNRYTLSSSDEGKTWKGVSAGR